MARRIRPSPFLTRSDGARLDRRGYPALVVTGTCHGAGKDANRNHYGIEAKSLSPPHKKRGVAAAFSIQ
jgi:hypothetical protein